MSNKDEPVMVYTTESVKEEIKKRADEEDTSVSTWCGQVIEEELADQALEKSADRLGLEKRMNRMFGRTADRVDRFLEDSLASETIDAVYSRAIWELVSTEYDAEERKQALEAAIEHVEAETNEPVDIDVDHDPSEDESERGTASDAD